MCAHLKRGLDKMTAEDELYKASFRPVDAVSVEIPKMSFSLSLSLSLKSNIRKLRRRMCVRRESNHERAVFNAEIRATIFKRSDRHLLEVLSGGSFRSALRIRSDVSLENEIPQGHHSKHHQSSQVMKRAVRNGPRPEKMHNLRRQQQRADIDRMNGNEILRESTKVAFFGNCKVV